MTAEPERQRLMMLLDERAVLAYLGNDPSPMTPEIDYASDDQGGLGWVLSWVTDDGIYGDVTEILGLTFEDAAQAIAKIPLGNIFQFADPDDES